MEIADGIEMLELPLNFRGRESIIYPTLIWDDHMVIIVDAGTKISLPEIKKAMQNAGVSFEKLDKIIVTHHDMDHMGGIRSILKELPHVEVLAHEAEKPYIQGEENPVRMNSNFIDSINSIPEEETGKNLDMFKNISVEVNTTLSDGKRIGVLWWN